ncbi:pentapeptide repeat-containing protein [Streptomyces sp. NBC_00539]|nr:pentapeptide repeat-containing protein [Streptomyces sp. NBC_00539]
MVASTLPGFAALAAALFTWLQVEQAGKELGVSQEGQITSRFNTAVVDLGSTSMHVRIGGIYALGRIMQDSQRDDPTVTTVLSGYVRDKAKRPTGKPSQSPHPTDDVYAALTVLVNRPMNPQRLVPNLKEIDLAGFLDTSVPLFKDNGLTRLNFRSVNLSRSDLSGAQFSNADFRHGFLDDANLKGTGLFSCDLSEAFLTGASLVNVRVYKSNLSHAHLGSTDLTGAFIAEETNLSDADLSEANLTGANLSHQTLIRVKLTRATLTRSNLAGADLRDADLRGVDFRSADLRGADLRGAALDEANLEGAKTDERTQGAP